MCDTCGCRSDDDEALAKVERIKAESNHLRGAIATELVDGADVFSEASMQLLKFHGIYQQEDRDRRKEARALGLAKHHQMMIRTRIPGGVMSAEGYLAHDGIAEKWGNGTIRLTTRQAIQMHGVLKGDLRDAIRDINAALLTTLGGCGDVERNIMCCPEPVTGSFRAALDRTVSALVAELAPSTGAYHEIWLDGELAVDSTPDVEPLYGDRYLPRKFKTAIGIEGDNCVDVCANDLGLVALRDADGGLRGFTAYVGGGLGRTRNKPETFAAVAQPLATVSAEHVVALSRAIVEVQRDHGDRGNRRHARMKYLIADRGLAWFREQVQARLDVVLSDPEPVSWPRVQDHLGWHDQGDGRQYLGLHVENGRIADTESSRLRTALREIATDVRPRLRLTPQQNVIIEGLSRGDRSRVEAILRRHDVERLEDIHPVRRLAMACPAIPTCGLAVAESERVLPALVREIAVLADEVGVGEVPMSVRMTGCPNGCARPYLGDVGLVGTTLGKYDLFLGGDEGGTRLNTLYAPAVRLDDVVPTLRPVLTAFAGERGADESFGAWSHRVGVEALQGRFADDRSDAGAVLTAAVAAS